MMFIYKILTSLVYYIFYPFLFFFFRKHNFKQRTSFRPLNVENVIWIHAASLGEINAVKPIIKKLIETYNNKTFMLTCVTKTGLEAANTISGKLIVHQFPLDIQHIMEKAFNTFKPALIILVETEIWPNMLNQAYKKNVPVLMINARLSQKSYKRYNMLRWFLRKEFSSIKLICAQSEKNAEKFRLLKFKNVINANNLKFTISLPDHDIPKLRQAWNYSFNDFVITFGCTRPGEEILMKKVFDYLYPLIPRLKMIIAPRHLHRIPEVLSIFNRNQYSLFSDSDNKNPIIIMDEMGVLPQAYALSDLAIIGGSFYNYGGHNPLEAIWYEKPVIMGPHHQSCAGTVEKLLQDKAIIISDADKLQNDIYVIFKNIENRISIGKKGKQILLENQDSLDKHWNAIIEWIK